MGLALLAGLVYMVRRRSKTSDGRDGTQPYLDDKKELDANQKRVHEAFEFAGSNRPLELSEQGLVELEHQLEHSAVELE